MAYLRKLENAYNGAVNVYPQDEVGLFHLSRW
jgi:hypothetical protein